MDKSFNIYLLQNHKMVQIMDAGVSQYQSININHAN